MGIVKNHTELGNFKQQALQWAASMDVALCLNSGGFAGAYSKFDCLIAAGVKHELKCNSGGAFSALSQFKQKHPGWLLGYLAYDLKNETEQLASGNADGLNFADMYFFVPRHVLIFRGNEVELITDDEEQVLAAISSQILAPTMLPKNISIESRFNKAEYIQAVQAIQHHILRGDIYEATFCQEFYAENANIDPLAIYTALAEASPAPFGAFFKLGQQYILSASPERFLAKRGNRLISQPIKGTAPRSNNAEEDERLKLSLKHHPKEQQENVMIVDLVRNDLTRSAVPGTVQVEELFGIYSFKQVHQMISTIVCKQNPEIDDVETIKNAFPMGSMTGAPKFNAMKLMEQYERSCRGVYSGAVGYFSPDGDFDFNVVIRSLLYNADSAYLSFQAGSAITHNAIAQNEYNECMLKVRAILEVLENKPF